MNERIEELAEQAGAKVHTEQTRSGDWVDFTDYAGFDLKKFAQLIVQECVTIINYGIDHTDYPHPNDVEKSMIEMKAQMWCRDAIKEHFGLDTYTK